MTVKTPALPTTKQQVEATPPGISPLARLLQSRQRPHVVITLPGFDEGDDGAQVAIVALRDAEFQDAKMAAVDWVLNKKKLAEWMLQLDFGQDILNNEFQAQVLHACMRQPKALEAKWTTSANDVRLHLEPDQRNALWDTFIKFQHARNPLREIRTDEELEEVIALVGKELSEQERERVLSFYASPSLRSIIIELADRVRKLTKPLSSPTTQPSD